jgi:hypothetical protein
MVDAPFPSPIGSGIAAHLYLICHGKATAGPENAGFRAFLSRVAILTEFTAI